MKTINGATIKRLFISGSNNLYNFYPEIDALNVFPVPDGDTGINMSLTLSSGCKEIQSFENNSAYEIAKRFSRGLLMGARGNSGVITSQIFRGLADGMKLKGTLTAKDFSKALENGVIVAYKAVVNPVEGTILTVIRESSRALAEIVNETTTIEAAFDTLIREANASLKRTPDLLPVLKKAGVVDSGGAGLIKILEGMKLALLHYDVERRQYIPNEEEKPKSFAGSTLEEEEFGYCTEFIMRLGKEDEKTPFDKDTFTKFLSEMGNSLVVVRDEDIVKVHVHTMTPGDALNYAQRFGEFIKLKIENMTEQHHNLIKSEEEGKVTEDDVVLEKTKNAIIAVSCGEGINNLFKELGTKIIISGGQTMNPSTEDFVKAIKRANADNIFILPNNKNILMSAKQARDLNKDIKNIYIVPAKTIPQGISAVSMFNDANDAESNFIDMNSALENVKSGEITYATRDTQVKDVRVKKNDFIGIFNHDLVVDHKDKVEASINLLKKMIDEENDSVITLLVGQDVTEAEREKIETYINKKYPDFDLDIREGNQPVYSFLFGVE